MNRAPLAALVLAGCQSAVGSIGADLAVDHKTEAVLVRAVAEGQAAHSAGLEPGDEVLFVDGTYARDLSPEQIRGLIRGEVGSAVDVTIVRPSGEIRWLRVVRTDRSLRPSKLIQDARQD